MTLFFNPRRTTILLAVALVAAVVVIYLPAIHGAWIWDDNQYIVQNLALRSAAGLRSIWLAPDGLNYFPVTFTVQWLQWHLWGDAVTGYHLTNVALHALNCLLLWRILLRLGVNFPGLIALLFAVHPLAVESVAWISELKNVLSLAFLFASALAYLRFEAIHLGQPGSHRIFSRLRSTSPTSSDGLRSGSPQGFRADPGVKHETWYLLSLGLFVLAMLSKSTVAPFPVVLALYVCWRHGRLAWRSVLPLLPFLAVALTLGLVTIWFEHHRAMPAGGGDPALPFWSRFAGAGLALAFYLEKVLLPIGLLPNYPQWRLEPLSPWFFAPWLFVIVWWRALSPTRLTSVQKPTPSARPRALLFGLAYFFLMLTPTLGLIPMAYLRIARVADHFAYAALPGLLAVIVGLFALALRAATTSARWAAIAFATAVCLALAWETRTDAQIYRNEETFWNTVLAHNPQSWLAHNQLGGVWLRQGKLEEATAQFVATTRIAPTYVEGRNNLGVALEHSGRLSESIEQFQDALQLRPGYRPAVANLAGAHLLMGDTALQQGLYLHAAEEYRSALAVQPENPAGENRLGIALFHLGRTAEAIEHYRRALSLRPNYPEARTNLGNALAQQEHAHP